MGHAGVDVQLDVDPGGAEPFGVADVLGPEEVELPDLEVGRGRPLRSAARAGAA